MRPTAEQQRDNHDWLFACIEGLWRHYCPRCAPDFLQQHLVTGIARS